jgi:hypothetical protein
VGFPYVGNLDLQPIDLRAHCVEALLAAGVARRWGGFAASPMA